MVDSVPAPRRHAPRPATRIVLVDDHRMFTSSLAAALADEADLDVVGQADSLATAVGVVRREQPDLVLLDQSLPDGAGVSVIPTLHEQSTGTRVIVLTASMDEDVLAAAVQAGCAGFVLKASPFEELLAAIRTVAAGDVHIPPGLLARLLPRLRQRGPSIGADLTPRELEVLGLLAEGLTNAKIAHRLTISSLTARNHVANLQAKLGAHSKLEALAIAMREGLIDARS
jgi:DNA-binding NarL/FixJ family response regulator